MSQDLEKGLNFKGGPGGGSLHDHDDANHLEDHHQRKNRHHHSYNRSHEKAHTHHCSHDKESSCNRPRQSDEANRKLEDSKKSVAHYAPRNMDDDVMQARRPAAMSEFAAMSSKTSTFQNPSSNKELFPANRRPIIAGNGIEDGKKAVAAPANLEHSKARFRTINEVPTSDDIELGASFPRISRQMMPGAVAVPGVNANEYDDDEGFTASPTELLDNDFQTEITQQEYNEPISAELIDSAEEERKRQEQVEEEVQLKLAEREKKVPVAEVVRPQKCGRRNLLIFGIAILLLLVVAVVTSVTLSHHEDLSPTPASQAPAIAVPKELTDLLTSISFDGGAALANSSTPQNSALIWLANNTNLDKYSNEKKIQRYALATLYYSTNGDKWTNNTGWLSDADECEWYQHIESYDDAGGSFCRDGDIVGLFMFDVSTLSGNNLDGMIPNEIALLSLEVIALPYNGLTGSIPSEIGLLKALNSLILSFNSLSGTIPSEIGLLTTLLALELSANSLMGTIPSEIGALTKLDTLGIALNGLSGTIPSEIHALTNLTTLLLNWNSLTGEYMCPDYITDCLISCSDGYNETCRFL